jgi:hypothetical protein
MLIPRAPHLLEPIERERLLRKDPLDGRFAQLQRAAQVRVRHAAGLQTSLQHHDDLRGLAHVHSRASRAALPEVLDSNTILTQVAEYTPPPQSAASWELRHRMSVETQIASRFLAGDASAGEACLQRQSSELNLTSSPTAIRS